MTRNEFLKMAGTSAALVVINTALVPTAIAAEPIGTVLSAKKSVNTGTAVSSATFELVPISRQTFWGDSGSCTLDYLSEGYIQWTIDYAISTRSTSGTEDVKYGLSKGKWEVEFTGIATAANGDMYSVVDGAKLTFSVTK